MFISYKSTRSKIPSKYRNFEVGEREDAARAAANGVRHPAE